MQGKKPCRHEGNDTLYQSDERKKPKTENTLLARLLLIFEGKIRSFTDKQNLEKHHLTGFTKNVKGISLGGKEKTTSKDMKTMKEKKSIYRFSYIYI